MNLTKRSINALYELSHHEHSSNPHSHSRTPKPANCGKIRNFGNFSRPFGKKKQPRHDERLKSFFLSSPDFTHESVAEGDFPLIFKKRGRGSLFALTFPRLRVRVFGRGVVVRVLKVMRRLFMRPEKILICFFREAQKIFFVVCRGT